MRVIPNYRLYGDQEHEAWARTYFVEAIPWRANRYNNDIRPHVHNAFIQLLYMKAGTVEVLLDQEKITAKAPCLIVVPAQVVHAFNFSDDVDGPVVTAAQPLLESLAQTLMPGLVTFIRSPAVVSLNTAAVTGKGEGPLDEPHAHISALKDLFNLLEKESTQHAPEQVAIGMPLVMALVAAFARVIGPLVNAGVGSLSAKTGTRSASTIARFRSLLDARFKEHLPIEQYAAELGVSAGHLSRICREALGISAQDVVNRRLLYAAQRELIHTNLPIKQLAAALGFSDENYFSRFFRKHTGVSPSHFRTQAH